MTILILNINLGYMINKCLCLFCILFLLGCARHNASIQMDESKQAYKKCLYDNPNNIQKCDALERAFKADLEAYRSL